MSAERSIIVGLFALCSGCGSLVGGEYPGELLYEIEGQVNTNGFEVEGDVGVALLWSNGFQESLGSQSVVVKTAFPARYTIEIYQPPGQTSVMPFLGDERIRAAVGDIVLYEDADQDGHWNRETEEIVGGAFDASLLWVAPNRAEADAAPPPGPEFNWAPEAGFTLVGRLRPFSCVEPWDLWLEPVPEGRADLQVSYYYPGIFDWDCDGNFGWEQPGEPGPPINEQCEPEVAQGLCQQYSEPAGDPNVDPAWIDEQGQWLQADPFALSCIELECPGLLDLLLAPG